MNNIRKNIKCKPHHAFLFPLCRTFNVNTKAVIAVSQVCNNPNQRTSKSGYFGAWCRQFTIIHTRKDQLTDRNTTMVIGPLADHAFCALSLILGFGEICTIVHGITSQPANVYQLVFDWHFQQPPTGWPKFKRGFSTRNSGFRGTWRSGMGQFDCPPMGLY